MSEAIGSLRGEVFNGLCVVRDRGLRGMITVRCDLSDAALRAAAVELAGVEFPDALRCRRADRKGLAWMSPDELLVMVDYGEVDGAVEKLRGALEGAGALVLDTSDARSVFSLEGSAARDVLAKLTPADVSPGALPVGVFRRTRLAQVPAGFWMLDAETAEIIVFRSVSRYVFDILKLAAHPAGAVGYHV